MIGYVIDKKLERKPLDKRSPSTQRDASAGIQGRRDGASEQKFLEQSTDSEGTLACANSALPMSVLAGLKLNSSQGSVDRIKSTRT